jgi:signal transduction histidine kinase
MGAARRSRLGYGQISRLVDTDRMEGVLAGVLALLVVLLDLMTAQAWQPMLLDLCACAAAACVPRWPRAAGAALGGILALYVFIPPEWATLGEYALLIPILGMGMRGRRRARALMTAAYFVILAAISWVDAPNGRSSVIGWILWAVLIAVLWLIGDVFVATVEAQRKARRADRLLQRQAIARDLHDRLSRSLTQVTMVAERARLRGQAGPGDLEVIAEAASRSNEELRWMLAILSDPSEDSRGGVARETPFDKALADAENSLTRSGFSVAVTVTGAISRLTDKQGDVLGEVTGEAAGNIIKHAEPDTSCAVIVDIGDTAAELVFVNRPRRERTSGVVSLGLGSMRERLASVGGRLVIDEGPDQWATRIVVPLSTHPTPTRAA